MSKDPAIVIASPPKPVFALRVGVTGHRQSRLAPDQLARIKNQIQTVLDDVSAAVKFAHEQFARDYATSEALLYFVSALADGADTLAAQEALQRGWRLLAPLPFSKEEYARDFSPADSRDFESLLASAHSVTELDGSRASPGQEEYAYMQAGVVTVDQSDILIAVWDGEEARGLGGTAMIKEEALSAGKPVIWINANANTPPVLLDRDNKERPFSFDYLKAVLTKVTSPPPDDEIEHEFSGEQTHALAAYRVYTEEVAHQVNYGSFFQFWEKVFAGRWPFNVKLWSKSPAEEIAEARKQTLASKVCASPHDIRVFDELIIPRFAWADHLALHYGNLYRSSYFFNYLFATAAVFLALLDLVAGDFGIGSKTIWISLEVTIIIAILMVTIAGKRGRWHEKWIDYRQLAEELRQYRLYYLTLGRETNNELTKGESGEAAGWVDWYFAATRREAGMTTGKFDEASIRTIAATVLNEEIKPQISYHDGKAHTLHAMEHRLHHLGEYAFGATLLVCLVYLALAFMAGKEPGLPKWAYATKNDIKGVVTMLTGFLPSLGAALFGIRVQGEFGSTAERSHATAAQLKTIAENFDHLANTKTPSLETLRIRVAEAARAMLMENMDWRLLYISKPLNLPG